MRIGDHTIGPGYPTYVIAEIGGNHNNNIEQAGLLIDAAVAAGADAAKFQLFDPDTLYEGKYTPGSIHEDWLEPLRLYCDVNHIDFICSIFDHDTLSAYMRINPVAIKIASPEATNQPLLAAAAATGKELLISTGATTFDDLDRLAMTLSRNTPDSLGFCEYALLHCVSSYPADPAELNLAVIRELADEYRDKSGQPIPIGLSDHTIETDTPAVAVAAGATIIEKHLTLNNAAPGLDHHYALEPDDFAHMVENIRTVETWLGDGNKRVMPSEDATDRR